MKSILHFTVHQMISCFPFGSKLIPYHNTTALNMLNCFYPWCYLKLHQTKLGMERHTHLFHLFLCKSEMNAGQFSNHHGSLIIVSNHFHFGRHTNICMVKHPVDMFHGTISWKIKRSFYRYFGKIHAQWPMELGYALWKSSFCTACKLNAMNGIFSSHEKDLGHVWLRNDYNTVIKVNPSLFQGDQC